MFVIIKYGLDEKKFFPQNNWAKKEKLVLFLGRGTLGKGFDTLVDAAHLIKGNIIAVASRIPEFWML